MTTTIWLRTKPGDEAAGLFSIGEPPHDLGAGGPFSVFGPRHAAEWLLGNSQQNP